MLDFVNRIIKGLGSEFEHSPIQATVGAITLATLALGAGASAVRLVGGQEVVPIGTNWQLVAIAGVSAGLLGALVGIFTRTKLLGGLCAYGVGLAIGYVFLQELVNPDQRPPLANYANAVGWAFGVTYFGVSWEAIWARWKNEFRDPDGSPTAMVFIGICIAILTWIIMPMAVDQGNGSFPATASSSS